MPKQVCKSCRNELVRSDRFTRANILRALDTADDFAREIKLDKHGAKEAVTLGYFTGTLATVRRLTIGVCMSCEHARRDRERRLADGHARSAVAGKAWSEEQQAQIDKGILCPRCHLDAERFQTSDGSFRCECGTYFWPRGQGPRLA